MALNNNRLGDAWVDTILECLGGTPVAGDITKLRTLMRGLAQDAIDEFINNSVVQTTVPNIQSGTETANGTGTITS